MLVCLSRVKTVNVQVPSCKNPELQGVKVTDSENGQGVTGPQFAVRLVPWPPVPGIPALLRPAPCAHSRSLVTAKRLLLFSGRAALCREWAGGLCPRGASAHHCLQGPPHRGCRVVAASLWQARCRPVRIAHGRAREPTQSSCPSLMPSMGPTGVRCKRGAARTGPSCPGPTHK